MNRQQFIEQYNDACVKAALGVHIIVKVGSQADIPNDTQVENINTLIYNLADGLGLSRDSVVEDVMTTFELFPAHIFQAPEMDRILSSLAIELRRQNLLPQLSS